MTTTPHRIGPVRWILADLATTVLGRRTGHDTDPIEQWTAQLRDMPAAAELTTPAAVNGVNTREAL